MNRAGKTSASTVVKQALNASRPTFLVGIEAVSVKRLSGNGFHEYNP